MIKCFALNGEFYDEGVDCKDFKNITDIFKINKAALQPYPLEAILIMINEYSKKLIFEKELRNIEGLAFLALWLKKSNLDKVVKLNIKDPKYIDEFVEIEEGKYIKGQPRGVVCHWIAGNVPTLAFYSVIQSLLCKNCNLVRIPQNSVYLVSALLKAFKDIEITYEGKKYYSDEILKTIALVYFDSGNIELNTKMSLLADCRVIWGGEEAVDSINSLPKKSTCKDIVFGPKYSFAVFDNTIIEDEELEEYLEALVKDIIIFEQKACSSPQVLFVEKSAVSLEDIACKLGAAFKKMDLRYPKVGIEQPTAARIINKRGEYYLETDKGIICSDGLQWTILIDNEFRLEEPVQGRTLFLKEIEHIEDVANLITSKVQTIGIASKNKKKIMGFAHNMTRLGVDRVVKVGFMNFYDSPWDGIMMMHELLRWCSLNTKGMF